MLELMLQETCRLSGEPLASAPALLDLPDCPIPGVYPVSRADSLEMRSPLRVVQAPVSGLVQLAHRFESSVYSDYGFAADTSQGYRAHLEWFAAELDAGLEPGGGVLEVGCGDGTLLSLLRQRGHANVIGIDPGRAAAATATPGVISGFFPGDLPTDASGQRYRRVIVRHVLEHIENPRTFIAELSDHLAADGELWIEVPDLDATLDGGRWSNFYQLHCNYFTADTLDRLAATAGLRCVGGTVVDVFGGSLLRRYRHGSHMVPAGPHRPARVAHGFASFQDGLAELAAKLPARSVGYGAAERTALTLGACPLLAERLTALHDGNALLHGRHLAGTGLEIRSPEDLYQAAPEAVVLFAVSHREEILREWHGRLAPGTLVATAEGDCRLAGLGQL